LRHRLDHIKHAADLVAFGLELVHRFAGVDHFAGQALDLRDRFADDTIAFACLLVGHGCRFRSLLGVARHFVDGGSHLVHRSCYLVGLDLLIVDPGAGLLSDRRQLFGGAGDLRHAITDAADQLAQALGHALHAGLQLTEFVAASRKQVLAQVAVGHALCGSQGLTQGDDDLPGNGPCREQAQYQGQGRGTAEHDFGLGGAGIAHFGLRNGHCLTGLQQQRALFSHALQGLLAGALGSAELSYRIAVSGQSGGRVVEAGGIFGRQPGGKCLELGQRLVDGLQRGLLVVSVAAVGVAAYLEARLLHQCADVHGMLVLADVATLQQALLHTADQLGGLVGAVTQHTTSGIAALTGLLELVEGLLVLADCGLLLLQALTVGGLLDLPEHEGDLALQIAQGLFQLSDGRVVAVALVVLAGDAQLLGVLVDHRDVAQFVTTLGDIVQTLPTGKGDGQGQHQHQAKAQPQLAIDAYIPERLGKPLVHVRLPGNVAAQIIVVLPTPSACAGET